MNLKLLTAGMAGLSLFFSGCETGKQSGGASSGPVSLSTNKDSVSYAIGNDISRSLDMIKDEIDINVLIASLQHNNAGSELLLKPEDSQALMQEFSKVMGQKQQEKAQADGLKNIEESKKFFEENKSKEGIVTTESGLQYKVLSQGSGPKPKETDNVTVHYSGTLLDGKEFDSSHKRGQPAVFQVNQVIKGWTEALLLMKAGSKYRLFIPPELGYGPRGSGQMIGPNAALIFEVDLISINH